MQVTRVLAVSRATLNPSRRNRYSTWIWGITLQARIQRETRGTAYPLKFNTLSFHVNEVFILHFIFPSL